MKKLTILHVSGFCIAFISLNLTAFAQGGHIQADPGNAISGDIFHLRGNVGIGFDQPNAKLDVRTDSEFESATIARFQLGQDSDPGPRLYVKGEIGKINLSTNYNSDGAHLSLGVAGKPDAVFINSCYTCADDGYVGIGTINPSAKLTLSDAKEPKFTIIRSDGGNNPRLHTGINSNEVYFEHTYASTGLPWNFKVGGTNVMTISGSKVGIGVSVSEMNTATSYGLYVDRGILTEEVKVAIKGTNDWSDYVFEDNYNLRSLADLENFINENNHLPNIPSACEVVENGVNLGEMDARLLEKIEELTLYVIELNKEIEALKAENQELHK